jgi:heat shock protein HslJ
MTASMASVFAQADRLGTRQWKLVAVEGAAVALPSGAYLELTADQTKFTGHTGCNRMFGTANIQARRLDFSNVGMTKMACVGSRVRGMETAFVRALKNVDRFRLRGDSLDLYIRNRVVLTFRAPAKQAPDNGEQGRGLEEKKWMLHAVKGVSVSAIGRTAFVSFDKGKGSAGGNSNCNVFGGSYTATGSSLKIVDVISTMRACEDDGRMEIEREFLDGLQTANRYQIRAGRLMLFRNELLLLTLNGEAK